MNIDFMQINEILLAGLGTGTRWDVVLKSANPAPGPILWQLLITVFCEAHDYMYGLYKAQNFAVNSAMKSGPAPHFCCWWNGKQ